jgi:hypothetical protein
MLGDSSLVKHRFWIGDAPFISTSLVLNRPPQATAQQESPPLILTCFDCDGEIASESTINLGDTLFTRLPLSWFITKLKNQYGMRCGQLVLTGHDQTLAPLIEIKREKASTPTVLPPLDYLETQGTCFPYYYRPNVPSMIFLVNFSNSRSDIAVKFFIGNRSPEKIISIPPLGSRAFSPFGTFYELLPKEGEAHGYLRLRVRTNTRIGALSVAEVYSKCEQHENQSNYKNLIALPG